MSEINELLLRYYDTVYSWTISTVIPAKAGIHLEIDGSTVGWKCLRMYPGLRRDDTAGG